MAAESVQAVAVADGGKKERQATLPAIAINPKLAF